MTARRPLAVLLAGGGLVALTGCQAPAPIVTLVNGTTTVHKEADVWCFGGQPVGQGNCAHRDGSVQKIAVKPGTRLGVDVSKQVAQRGWVLQLSSGDGGQPQTTQVLKDTHYFSFTAPDVSGAGLKLTVNAVEPNDPAGQPTGQWTFQLVPQ